MDSRDSDITLKMVLDHMRPMEQRLTLKMEEGNHVLLLRIDGVETKVMRMERNLKVQINAIDQRLDVIEIEHFPKRVAALERRKS